MNCRALTGATLGEGFLPPVTLTSIRLQAVTHNHALRALAKSLKLKAESLKQNTLTPPVAFVAFLNRPQNYKNVIENKLDSSMFL